MGALVLNNRWQTALALHVYESKMSNAPVLRREGGSFQVRVPVECALL